MNKIQKKKQNFVQISNNFIRDNRISFKAKGLFCYMYSMEANWNFTLQSIATQQNDGLSSITTAINELKEFGYVVYEKLTSGRGIYHLNDEPKSENPNMDFPIMAKSHPIKNTNLIKNTNTKNSNDVIKTNNKEALLETAEKYLKAHIKLKSKISFTKEFKKLYFELEDRKKFLDDYIKHIEDKQEFAKRITAYLLDYEAYKTSEASWKI